MQVVLRIQEHFQVRIAEWLMAGVMFSWGAHLLIFPHTFMDNRMFTDIRQYISEPIMGYGTLMYGIARAVLLVINGAWRPSPHLRALLAAGSSFFWLQIFFGVAHTMRDSIIQSLIPWFILVEFWSVMHAMNDARHVDDKYRAIKASV